MFLTNTMASLALLGLLLLSVVAADANKEGQLARALEFEERFVPPIDRSYIENHPYQVSVERIGGRTCGGAIITELHILTAASCATNIINVRVGTNFANLQGFSVRVEKITLHPKYNPVTYKNDVAVLKLYKRLTFSSTVHPIPLLLKKRHTKEYRFGNLTGYGITQESSFFKPLEKVSVLITDDADLCRKQDKPTLTDDKICARPTESRVKCVGNCGDPVVYDNKLYGLLSYSRVCISPGKSLVFSNILSALNFIVKEASIIPE